MHLSIHKVVRETSDCISIHFQQPWHKMLDYKAGQFLTVICTVNGKQERRAYSLCSSPHADAFPAIAVKVIPNGLVSNYLFEFSSAGKGIELLEPMGNFVFEPKADNRRHIILYAAGSGITPLFSIIKSALKMEPLSYITLIYGNRNIDSIIFKEQITELQQQNSTRFQVIHSLTSPPDKWYGATGRISAEMLNEILDQSEPILPVSETLHYMCGPAAMMDSVKEVLASRGVSKSTIFHESFFSSIDDAARELAIEEQGIKERTIKVIYDADSFNFLVPAHKTILEAAQDKDIDLPYSCQSGLCTACRGKCISGKVHLDESDGLSQKELDNGYILTCVAHPLTDDVVIEIG